MLNRATNLASKDLYYAHIIKENTRNDLSTTIRRHRPVYTYLGEIFNKPIEILYVGRDGEQIKLGVDAPEEINIVMGELLEKAF